MAKKNKFLPKLAMAFIDMPEPEEVSEDKIDYVISEIETRTPFWEASVKAHDEDPSYAVKQFCNENGLDFPGREVYQLENEAIETIKFFKRKFSKDRPYEAARKLGMPELDRLPSKTNKTRSYPSGHSTQGYLAGLYVANKYPDYSDGIMTAGLECGIGRIKAGFHYLDDHHGGIHLAQQIFRLIKK